MSVSDSCVEMLMVGTIRCQTGARLLGCPRSRCAVSLLLDSQSNTEVSLHTLISKLCFVR